MRIERVEIRNFRCFSTFDLDLAGDTTFIIGENGGGKSTLLTGIARALGRDLSFARPDFGDANAPVELRVTLSNLSPGVLATFANYVDFTARGPELRMETKAFWDASSEEAEVEHGYPKVAGSRSRRSERDAIPLQWLPATRDAGRMLQMGVAQNLMGRLLEILPIQGSLDTAATEIHETSQHLAADPAFGQLLVDAQANLATLLPSVATNAVSLDASTVTPRDLLRLLEVFVSYQGDPIGVARQSNGIAQLTVFVFAVLLASRDANRILLVDEPEVSLHPQSQRALMKLLRGLRSQLLIATHSANLLDRADPRTVVRLARVTGGISQARPTALSDADAARLARFTTPQAAEAFFARTVVLVEGLSDQMVIEALAERLSKNLDGSGVAIVPTGGAATMTAYAQLYGPQGFRLELLGLTDEAEEGYAARALQAAGHPAGLSRLDREALGFFVCVRDLEEELIRAIGAGPVETLIRARGDGPAFDAFVLQPTYAGSSQEASIRAFVQHRSRKVEYAPVLADAVNLGSLPVPIQSLLGRI
jgi:predicted ATPase